jgi:hypothetical protein
VEDKGLHFYYRKKELMFLSREEAKHRLKEKKSLWGRYLELETEKRELKNHPLNLKFLVVEKVKIRFYLKDPDRVMNFIKNY